ncbi:ribbon-helix-helix domain-containing protein [Streptomyces sp. NPDC052496]|uniref:ribbon-helix-helix domain-containing protein n=1 Tax=Streptomyces sp. NPDC052496 TaxID=3154951 RepID=UPI00341A3C20
MKISVSLPEEDVAFVDAYGKKTDAQSRSAVIHAAVELLRTSELEADYASAWEEWDESDDAQLWDRTSGDGIVDAAR